MHHHTRRLLGFGLLAATGCSVYVPTARLREPTVASATEALAALRAGQDQAVNVHLADGGLILLRHWSLDETQALVGAGIRYDADRMPRDAGPVPIRIPLDSVAALQTIEIERAAAPMHALRNAWYVSVATSALFGLLVYLTWSGA